MSYHCISFLYPYQQERDIAPFRRAYSLIKSIYHMSTVQVPLAQQEAKDSKFAVSVSHKTRFTITTASAREFIDDEAGWVIDMKPMYVHLA